MKICFGFVVKMELAVETEEELASEAAPEAVE